MDLPTERFEHGCWTRLLEECRRYGETWMRSSSAVTVIVHAHTHPHCEQADVPSTSAETFCLSRLTPSTCHNTEKRWDWAKGENHINEMFKLTLTMPTPPFNDASFQIHDLKKPGTTSSELPGYALLLPSKREASAGFGEQTTHWCSSAIEHVRAKGLPKTSPSISSKNIASQCLQQPSRVVYTLKEFYGDETRYSSFFPWTESRQEHWRRHPRNWEHHSIFAWNLL